MERRITVIGRAKVTAPADITIVRTSVSGKEDTYEKAVSKMTETTVKLKDAIEAAGLSRDKLKTSSLSVRQAYRKKKIGEDRYDNDKFEDVPDGYEYSQNVSFEFENSNEILSECLTNINNLEITPKIQFDFRTKDPEAFKLIALAEASKNARDQAETIVTALGAKLGKIVSISKDRVYSRYDDEEDCGDIGSVKMCANSLSVDVDPEDIATEQTVTVIWEIDY